MLDGKEPQRKKLKMYGEDYKSRVLSRKMHKVACAECSKETEVPFKSDGTRPVYCRAVIRNENQEDFSKK